VHYVIASWEREGKVVAYFRLMSIALPSALLHPLLEDGGEAEGKEDKGPFGRATGLLNEEC
jgi:hypothetical protein